MCVTDAIKESAITVGFGDLADSWRSGLLIRAVVEGSPVSPLCQSIRAERGRR